MSNSQKPPAGYLGAVPLGLPSQVIEPVLEGIWSGEEFGTALSVSGDWMAVGHRVKYWYSEGSKCDGAVNVYRRVGGTWYGKQHLTPEVYGRSGSVGYSVGISGGTIATGAPYEVTTTSGAVYVFIVDEDTLVWSQQQRIVPPTTGIARFGRALAIHEDTLAIGSESGKVFIYTRSGGVWSYQATITTPTAGNLYFGFSVHLDSGTLISASRAPGSPYTGEVNVFTGADAVWTHQQTLTAGGASDQFAKEGNWQQSIALSGDTIAATASYAPDSYGSADRSGGCIYIFKRSAGVWAQTQLILNRNLTSETAGAYAGSHPFTGGAYGQVAVHLAGDWLVSGDNGASRPYTPASWPGEAVLFTLDAVTGQYQTLKRFCTGAIGEYGVSVWADPDNERVYVGSENGGRPLEPVAYYNDIGLGNGNVLSFPVVDTCCGLRTPIGAELAAPRVLGYTGQTAGDAFGTSCAIDDAAELIAVSAPGSALEAAGRGAVLIFSRTPNSITSEGALLPDDSECVSLGGGGTRGAAKVAIDGDWCIVGAPASSNGATSGAGAAYIYKRSQGGTWAKNARLQPDNVNASAAFGASVDISGDYCIVGAPGDTSGGTGRGAVYIYKVSGDVWSQNAKFTGGANNCALGAAVAISGEKCWASYDYSGASGATGIRWYAVVGGTWTYKESLFQRGIAAADAFGSSLACSSDGGAHLAIGAHIHGAAAAGASFIAYKARYTDDTDTWRGAQVVTVPSPDVGTSLHLGWSVAIDDDVMLTGTKGTDGAALHGVYVYHRNPGVNEWFYQQRVLGPNGDETDFDAGSSVAIRNSVAVIGCPSADPSSAGAAAVYIVNTVVRDDIEVHSECGVRIINTVPEDVETGVPATEVIRLQGVSFDCADITDAKVWVLRSSTSVRELAYDMANGGFQAGWDGPESSAVLRSSPGSLFVDEIVLVLDCTSTFASLEVITVEAQAQTDLAGGSLIYSFTIEDLTAPELTEILWLNPRFARVKWNEPVDTSSDPGGSTFVSYAKGNVEVLSTTQVQLVGVTGAQSWIGMWVGMANSAHPQNHQPRPITAVSVSSPRASGDLPTTILTLDTSSTYGGSLVPDDGHDFDQNGTLLDTREISISVSPYRFYARLDEEGASEHELSAERIQCAYLPFVIAASIPDLVDLPAGEDPDQYTYLSFNDDISFGRLYSIRADGVEDLNENVAVDTRVEFTSPWFGVDRARLGFWSEGIIPGHDKKEDLEHDGKLRRLAVVLQDLLNSLWQRCDELQYLEDPFRCPEGWVEHLLYNLGQPFSFPLDTVRLKRKLANALPEFYPQVGVARAIEEMLFLLLGIHFTIVPYNTAGYWTIGDPDKGRLGFTTILGPGTPWAKNSYEINSPIVLTDEQRRIVTEVATWADPWNKHLAKITEPGEGILGDWWIMSQSILGFSTKLYG